MGGITDMMRRAPTSGGQYHWVAMLAPPKSKVFLSWFTGEHIEVKLGQTAADNSQVGLPLWVGWPTLPLVCSSVPQ